MNCTQCGRPISDPDEVEVVESIERDETFPQEVIDEWLVEVGLDPGLVKDVGVRLVHVVGLCSTCAERVPNEPSD